MNEHQIILFCGIPLAAGIISLPLKNQLMLSRAIGVASFASLLALALVLIVRITPDAQIIVSQGGAWAAPFGISLVFDSLSGLLIAAAAAVALGAYVHSFKAIDPYTERRYFHPLMQLLIFGVNLSFLTGDLFNLFVAFEIMLMASYGLMVVGGAPQQLAQAYKYILLNVLASTLFLMAAGMTYGMLGTLNLADLARILRSQEAPPGFNVLAVTFLLVFGLKGAFFPFWFWLPDTYYTMPISVAGLFGGLLTKVGVYAVVRTFPLVFAATPDSARIIQPLIAVAAAFTMFLAVLGAVSQHNVRRILSIHVISQVGYMVFGIAIGVGVAAGTSVDVAKWALAGCVFYMIQHMVVKCALFLCCGVMEKHAGTDDLDHLGGLLRRDVWLGVLFFVAAMSLVGLPPLSGFFGKMVIIREGWHDYWWLSVLGLLTGALTLLSMLKIWSYGYWNPVKAPQLTTPRRVKRDSRSCYAGIGFLVVAALFLGFGAGPVYQVALNAGRQSSDPLARDYITAVLGESAFLSIERQRKAQARPDLAATGRLDDSSARSPLAPPTSNAERSEPRFGPLTASAPRSGLRVGAQAAPPGESVFLRLPRRASSQEDPTP